MSQSYSQVLFTKWIYLLKRYIMQNNIKRYAEVSISIKTLKSRQPRAFAGGSVIKNLPTNTGDTSLIPGPGRSRMPQDSQAHVATAAEPKFQSPRATREASAVRGPGTSTE